jgi:hypothetical protein
MRFRSCVISVLLLIAARLAYSDLEFRQEPPIDIVVEHRDLNVYADGGEFSSNPLSHGEVVRIDELRQFIWRHWREKTRVYARLFPL